MTFLLPVSAVCHIFAHEFTELRFLPLDMSLADPNPLLQQAAACLSDDRQLHGLLHECCCSVPLPSAPALAEVIELCRAVLFPGFFGDPNVTRCTLQRHMTQHIQRLQPLLAEQILSGLCFHEPKDDGKAVPESSKAQLAQELATKFICRLPELRQTLATDVEASYKGDPAAESRAEIISCYPVIKAVTNYRIAHELLLLGVPLIPRIITEMAHSETGIDIHPAATIGSHFTIDHGTGVVIGATCIIGNNVKLYQGVTLGAKSFPLDEEGNPIKGIPRHPILEDDVIVYSNATVLGRITIGRGTVIGGNVWVTESTKPGQQILQGKKIKSQLKEIIIKPEDYGGL